MKTTLENIRAIKEGQYVLINGIKHLCTMAVGFAYHPEMNFRFTNMLLPKKIRHSVYDEYYLHCDTILKDMESKVLDFVITNQTNTKEQLSLF